MASTLVLAVVFIFDLIAFGLAVAAEQRRSSVSFSDMNFFFLLIFLYKKLSDFISARLLSLCYAVCENIFVEYACF